VIHSPPEIVSFSVDFYEHFVQVPLPLPIRMSAKVLNPFSSDLRGKQRAKHVPPKLNPLVADLDAALVQQILHISE
jgi:hypothetical protein